MCGQTLIPALAKGPRTAHGCPGLAWATVWPHPLLAKLPRCWFGVPRSLGHRLIPVEALPHRMHASGHRAPAHLLPRIHERLLQLTWCMIAVTTCWAESLGGTQRRQHTPARLEHEQHGNGEQASRG